MQAETDLLKSKMYEIESLVYHAEIIELRNIGQVRLQDQEGKQKELDALEEKIQAEIKSLYGWFMSINQKFEIDRQVREKYAHSV